MYQHNEDAITLSLKNIYLSLYFMKGLKLAAGMWEKDRDRVMKDTDIDWWRTAILTFSWPMLWFHIHGLTSLLPWREVFNPGLWWATFPNGWPPGWLLPLFGGSSNWLTVTLKLTVFCGYLCIYYFITPMSSGCDSRDLLPLVNPCELSPSLHSWNIQSQKSLIDGSVKCQYATLLFFKMSTSGHFPCIAFHLSPHPHLTKNALEQQHQKYNYNTS